MRAAKTADGLPHDVRKHCQEENCINRAVPNANRDHRNASRDTCKSHVTHSAGVEPSEAVPKEAHGLHVKKRLVFGATRVVVKPRLALPGSRDPKPQAIPAVRTLGPRITQFMERLGCLGG